MREICLVKEAGVDEQDEITRPRRRGEPRPEPSPEPAGAEAAAEPGEHGPEPAGMDAQAEALEAEQEQPPAQPPVQQPQSQAAQPQLVAEITRQCSFCFTQQPLSTLDDLGPLMRQCKDAAACAERAAASGMYPLSETELEAGLSAWEAQQGAIR